MLAPCLRSFHCLSRHLLAEGNVGGFQQAAAGVAGGGGENFRQLFVNAGRLKSFAALETGHEVIGAVQLNNFIVRDTSDPVQSIDVLRDESKQMAALFEVANRIVADIRLDLLV